MLRYSIDNLNYACIHKSDGCNSNLVPRVLPLYIVHKKRMLRTAVLLPHLPESYMLLHLLVVVDVDVSLLPLTSGNLAVEQDVNLAVGSVLHLRQEEERDNETEETSASPDITALAAKVSAL